MGDEEYGLTLVQVTSYDDIVNADGIWTKVNAIMYDFITHKNVP